MSRTVVAAPSTEDTPMENGSAAGASASRLCFAFFAPSNGRSTRNNASALSCPPCTDKTIGVFISRLLVDERPNELDRACGAVLRGVAVGLAAPARRDLGDRL